MSQLIYDATVKISADTSNLEQGLKNANQKLGETQNTAKTAGLSLKEMAGMFGLATTASGLALQAFNAIVDGLKKQVAAAKDDETAFTRLNATLQSTGRAGETSVASIDRMATSLRKMGTFDDTQIVSAFNAIAKFSNIPTSSMENVVKAAMNMTAALGGDLSSNAEDIGRVLETGLIPRTWGFDAALKATIQSEIKAGDSAGALKTMLSQLGVMYGGQATAAVKTYAGSVERIKAAEEAWNSAVGSGLLPTLRNLNEQQLKVLNARIALVNNGKPLTEANIRQQMSFDAAAEAAQRYGDAMQDFYSKRLPQAAQGIQDMTGQFNFMIGYASSYMDIQKQISDVEGQIADKRKAGYTSTAEGSVLGGLYSQLDALKKKSADTFNQMILDMEKVKITADGIITSEEIDSFLGLAQNLGLMDDSARKAAISAWEVSQAIASLHDKHIVISVDTIYNEMYGSGSTSKGNTHGVSIAAQASGGPARSRYSLVGDMHGGIPTPFSELIDWQRQYVYNADQTRQILKGGVPHNSFAGGGGVSRSGGGVKLPDQVGAFGSMWWDRPDTNLPNIGGSQPGAGNGGLLTGPGYGGVPSGGGGGSRTISAQTVSAVTSLGNQVSGMKVDLTSALASMTAVQAGNKPPSANEIGNAVAAALLRIGAVG